MRVLTVDDSKTMLSMLKRALTSGGYDVSQAMDGLEGLKSLREEGVPSIIITDINMPNMDGFEFIEAVRADPLLKHIPIITLTTESDPEKKARARKAGATGWIVKPFKTEALLSAIRRVTA